MSAFHIMLHNAVSAHKSHVAGLTPLPVKLAQNTLKTPVEAFCGEGRRTTLKTFACSLSKLRCLDLEKVLQAVVVSVPAASCMPTAT